MFWDKFQSLCDSINKSPNKVASEIGIASGTLTNWKQGGMPRWSAIDKVCEYFHVTREYFFPSEQKEKPAASEVDVDKLIRDILNLPRDKKEELFAKFMDIMNDGE